MSVITPQEIAHVASTKRAAPVREWLGFHVGDEAYCIDLQSVREIRSNESPTPMAGAPASFRGLLDLRGEIVPVIDLRALLGCPMRPDPICIVLSCAGKLIGVFADRVNNVVLLAPGQIRPMPALGAAVRCDHLLGIGVPAEDAGGAADARPQAQQLLDIETLLRTHGLLDLASTH